MSQEPAALTVLRATAKVSGDGALSVNIPSDLAPGDYEAVLTLRAVPKREDVRSTTDAPIEPLDRFLDRMRREHLHAALARAEGNRTQAAKLLGVDIRTVFRFLEKDDS
jgi:transcriptional regulator with PAS, ATPase and Fis domain